MFEVRFHGRGGQGVVTAAELLSLAAFVDGAYSQAFPSFGSERTGAPVVSFCRIDDHQIRTREPVLTPDAVVIQDHTLLHQVDVFGGLRDDGYALLNSSRELDHLGLGEWVAKRHSGRVMTLDATRLAREHTGGTRANAVLLGGLAALTGIVSLQSVKEAIAQRLPATFASSNSAAAAAGFAAVEQEARVA
ncbi:MAG TPA: 2-oxoacid:acceptor oxidoreductase family protein [Solirubrobacteraceae bacterium]|nr:2-oxoacid:acceptor oxidoreductase family protein [Solirubrobacteraceae bacterium]